MYSESVRTTNVLRVVPSCNKDSLQGPGLFERVGLLKVQSDAAKTTDGSLDLAVKLEGFITVACVLEWQLRWMLFQKLWVATRR